MTAARQERKRHGAFLAVMACITMTLPHNAHALTDRVVVDWHTGLAIGGYDPVAYFTDGKPKLGDADLEFRYAGVIWRFCNIGNRAAFAAHPETYMPRFGGYDPTGVANGVAVAGNATVWSISGQRLYLFYDAARLGKFRADVERIIAEAGLKWPHLSRTLSQ